MCLKKNQNAPRPSEHPPVMGKLSETNFGAEYNSHMILFERMPVVCLKKNQNTPRPCCLKPFLELYLVPGI